MTTLWGSKRATNPIVVVESESRREREGFQIYSLWRNLLRLTLRKFKIDSLTKIATTKLTKRGRSSKLSNGRKGRTQTADLQRGKCSREHLERNFPATKVSLSILIFCCLRVKGSRFLPPVVSGARLLPVAHTLHVSAADICHRHCA